MQFCATRPPFSTSLRKFLPPASTTSPLVFKRLIPFLQVSVGDFDAPSEPEFCETFRVADELVDNFGPKRHAGNKRM